MNCTDGRLEAMRLRTNGQFVSRLITMTTLQTPGYFETRCLSVGERAVSAADRGGFCCGTPHSSCSGTPHSSCSRCFSGRRGAGPAYLAEVPRVKQSPGNE